MRLSVREGLVWSIMWGFGEAYIQPFAIFLHGGPTIMALLGTLPGLVGSLGQFLGTFLMERLGLRRPLLVVATAIQALTFIPLLILPRLFPDAGATWVLWIYVTATFLFSGIAPLWTSLMGDVVPEDQRGRFFSARSRTVMVGMVFSMLAASQVLSRFTAAGHAWLGFGVLFGAATLARLVSVGLLRQHVDPRREHPATVSTWTAGVGRRLRESPFAFFALTQTLLSAAFALAAPFFTLYMLRDLHWSYLQFTTMTVAFFVAQIAVVQWWGRLSDRHGNRVVFKAACFLLPLPHVVWFFATDFRVLLGAHILHGALMAGTNLAAGNYMFDSVSPAYRARVISYQSLINALLGLGAGLLGAALARHLPATYAAGSHVLKLPSNLPLIFLGAGLLRLLLSLILLPRLREIRSIEPISSLEIMRRFALAEPLREQWSQAAAFFNARRAGKPTP